MATWRIEEAAYEPDGEAALRRVKGLRVRLDLPLTAIRQVTITPARGRQLRFRVEAETGQSAAFRIPGTEAGHLVEGFVRQLGDRCVCRFDPGRLQRTRPRPHPLLWGVGLILLGASLLAGTLFMVRQWDPPPWLLLCVLGLAGVLTAAYGVRRLVGGLRQRRIGRAQEPFRSTALSLVLKVLGLALFLVAFYVPVVTCARVLWGGAAPGWAGGEAGDVPLGIQAAQFKFLILGTTGAFLLQIGYRLGLASGTRVLAKDTRAPIVYLRSFEDDGRHDLNTGGLLPFVLGLRTFGGVLRPLGPIGNLNPLRMLRLLCGSAGDTAEEQIARFFHRLGPFVAIGRPGEGLSTGGASRFYVDDDTWQQRVHAMIDRAAAVVLQPSDTQGIWWEIAQCLERVPPARLLLCLVSYAGSQQAYEEFRLRFEPLVGQSLPRVLGDGIFLRFDDDWTPHLIGRTRCSELLWPLTGVSLDFRLMLWRFLAPLYPGRFRGPVPRRRRAWLHVPLALLVYVLAFYAFNFAVGGWTATVARLYEMSHGPLQAHTGTDPAYRWDLSAPWQPQPAPAGLTVLLKEPGGLTVNMGMRKVRLADQTPVIDAILASLRRPGLPEPRVVQRRTFEREGRPWQEVDMEAVIPGAGRSLFYCEFYSGVDGTFQLTTELPGWVVSCIPGAEASVRRVLDGFHLPALTPEERAAESTTPAAALASSEVNVFEGPGSHYRIGLSRGWLPSAGAPGVEGSFAFGLDTAATLAIVHTGDILSLDEARENLLSPATGAPQGDPGTDFQHDGQRWRAVRWEGSDQGHPVTCVARIYSGLEGSYLLLGEVRHEEPGLDRTRLALIERGFDHFTLPALALRDYPGGELAYHLRLPTAWQKSAQAVEGFEQVFTLGDGGVFLAVAATSQPGPGVRALVTAILDSIESATGSRPEISPPQTLESRGRAWTQFQYDRTVPGRKIHFVSRVYSGRDGAMQLTGWTSAARFPRYQAAILAAFDGVELPPAAAPTAPPSRR